MKELPYAFTTTRASYGQEDAFQRRAGGGSYFISPIETVNVHAASLRKRALTDREANVKETPNLTWIIASLRAAVMKGGFSAPAALRVSSFVKQTD